MENILLLSYLWTNLLKSYPNVHLTCHKHKTEKEIKACSPYYHYISFLSFIFSFMMFIFPFFTFQISFSIFLSSLSIWNFFLLLIFLFYIYFIFSTCFYLHLICLSIFWFLWLSFFYRSIYSRKNLSICSSFYLSFNFFFWVPTLSLIYSYFNLSLFHSIHLCFYQFIYLYLFFNYLYIYQFIFLSFHPSNFNVSFYLYIIYLCLGYSVEINQTHY